MSQVLEETHRERQTRGMLERQGIAGPTDNVLSNEKDKKGEKKKNTLDRNSATKRLTGAVATGGEKL